MNLSIAKSFAKSTIASRGCIKLAPFGAYVGTDDGVTVWSHQASDVGFRGDEWMADMLNVCDPFQYKQNELNVVGCTLRERIGY